ncbi:hypothetical protein JCM11491_002006 [Sporobolomyces phaffii]
MGIDCDLFESLPDYLTCQVCMNALSDAHSFCQQDHLTCRDCAKDLFRRRRPVECPQCREPARTVTPNLAVSRMVANLKVRCTWSGAGGCGWTGNAGDLIVHQEGCVHRPQPCTHRGEGCQFKGSVAASREHLATECLFASMRCPRAGCGAVYVRSTSEGHDDVCIYYPCTVSPGCVTLTARRHLVAHERGCSNVRNMLEEQFSVNATQRADLDAALQRIEELEIEKLQLQALASEEKESESTANLPSRNTRPAENVDAAIEEPSPKRPKTRSQSGARRPSLNPPTSSVDASTPYVKDDGEESKTPTRRQGGGAVAGPCDS